MAHIDPYGVPQFLDQPGWIGRVPVRADVAPPDTAGLAGLSPCHDRQLDRGRRSWLREIAAVEGGGPVEPNLRDRLRNITGQPQHTADGSSAYCLPDGSWLIVDEHSIAHTTVRPRMEGEPE